MFNLFDPNMFVLRLIVGLEFDCVVVGFIGSSVDVLVDVVVVESKTDVAEVVEVLFIDANIIVVVLVDFDEEVKVVVIFSVLVVVVETVFVDDGNVVASVFVDLVKGDVFVVVDGLLSAVDFSLLDVDWMSYTTFKEFRSSYKTVKNEINYFLVYFTRV